MNESHTDILRSPNAGIFRLNLDSGTVQEGDVLVKGQLLCTIQFNGAETGLFAPKDGTLVKILVDDSKSVDFDQELFLVEISPEDEELTSKQKLFGCSALLGIFILLVVGGYYLITGVVDFSGYAKSEISDYFNGSDNDDFNVNKKSKKDCSLGCNGEGFTTLECFRCESYGEVDCSGQDRDGCNNGINKYGLGCYKCGGRGAFRCSFCNGNGYFEGALEAANKLEARIKSLYLPLWRIPYMGDAKEYYLRYANYYACPKHNSYTNQNLKNIISENFNP
ncbi:MAG: biotin/lipoyl-containing protein [Wenyingzhuangia sp.]|uniref:acetyl-CoA carboxylase biotin carboxyl carrier protein n=1 Tax=Wenyingzhuangia sp. TaxID=1964193 RepID=UPI00321B9E8B